jgi:hypothetical protein
LPAPAQHFCRSAFAPLRANADTTSLAGISVLIADALVTVSVLSAFARRGAKADLQKCCAKNVVPVRAS